MNKNGKTVQEITALRRKISVKIASIKDEETLSKLKIHGGKRDKSGRKPIQDRKKQIQISLRQSEFDAIGGEEKAKKIALEALKKIILGKD